MRNAVLVLDVSMQFVGMRTVRKGMSYIVKNKGYSLLDTERLVRTQNGDTHIPSIVVLYKAVAHKRPTRTNGIPWSRIGVLIRDGRTCAYCEKPGNTIDHIYPRALGGKNTWINTITACADCNGKKGMRTLEESGMVLRFEPKVPLDDAQERFLRENHMEYVLERLTTSN